MESSTIRPSVRFPRAELPPGTRKVVTLKGREVVVFNVDGDLYALFDRCPHQQAPLHAGPLHGTSLPSDDVGDMTYGMEGRVLRCPWHHYEFDLENGRCMADGKRLRVRTYRVREEENEIVVDTARPGEDGP
jgi:3-phenylpropionate/trans-cinnamate dioxygenase ferredoxin subunit